VPRTTKRHDATLPHETRQSNGCVDPLWHDLLSSSSSEVQIRSVSQKNDVHVHHNLTVTRYHSLMVNLSQPSFQQLKAGASALIPTVYAHANPLLKSRTESDLVLMAMRHTELPHFGVQFHPESLGGNPNIGTALTCQFCQLCVSLKEKRNSSPPLSVYSSIGYGAVGRKLVAGEFPLVPQGDISTSIRSNGSLLTLPASDWNTSYQVFIHKVLDIHGVAPVEVMKSLFCDQPYSFWLDGGPTEDRNDPGAISILGAGNRRLEYWGKERDVSKQGLYEWHSARLAHRHPPDLDILQYLRRSESELDKVKVDTIEFYGDFVYENGSSTTITTSEHPLPFDFRGGYVGYLGYEVRYDTAEYLALQEYGQHKTKALTGNSNKANNPKVPTAAFLWAERSMVYHYSTDSWYLVGVADKTTSVNTTITWMIETLTSLQRLETWGQLSLPSSVNPINGINGLRQVDVEFRPNRSREMYNANFEQCINYIRLGESYELCLTNQLEATVTVENTSPLDLYLILRQKNQAPHSAFLNWNSQGTKTSDAVPQGSMAICCSSPERFVSVTQNKEWHSKLSSRTALNEFVVEAKPIKGTCARVGPMDGVLRTKEEQIEDNGRISKRC
jgi:para-aminobenzoate synthetase